ncbi:hypothetical protein K402DRAFT_462612 [Aulographum hederae CBS 113979]|uniref:Uncharacterized protein n=1 Tax=Aulographum hederae CBS 113979 TaxID=1176131 RepID=A0A6G1H409_9PEZI|nr:hypothetical protein K402DRAFT_462612 [Aulographum hederae CBS 113979]
MSSRESSDVRRRRRRDSDRTRDRSRAQQSRDYVEEGYAKVKSRDKDREKDKEKDKDKVEKRRRIVRRRSSSKDADRDRERDRDRSYMSSSSQILSPRKSSVPEMERRPSSTSTTPSKASAYPSFSKAHSREAVGPRDVNPRLSLYTPDPTDLGHTSARKTPVQTAPTGAGAAPPSPPLTATEPDLRRTASGTSFRKATNKPSREGLNNRRSVDTGLRQKMHKHSASTSSLPQTSPTKETASPAATASSSKPSTPLSKESTTRSTSYGSTLSANTRPTELSSSAAGSNRTATAARSTTDSDATSIAADRKAARKMPAKASDMGSSPVSAVDSSPRTPTPHETQFPRSASAAKEPPIEVFASNNYRSVSVGSTQYAPGPPPPPPPPPPVDLPVNTPRVDYLLQNGGLPQPIPRSLLQVPALQSNYGRTTPGHPQTADIKNIFAPFQNVLDDYSQVISKNGSIAVATGYRSVARRLLDRLEAVFARNISSEKCGCIICMANPPSQDQDEEEDTGVSWGEILELVSGRRELPSWPPFSISTDGPGLGISAVECATPMQKLDIDVPEEFRDHYIRQSKKTKHAVQNWLGQQPELPSSPPQEVDDETLAFAMITHLEAEHRQVFTALLRGMSNLPSSRAPTPVPMPTGKPKPELISKTATALQRLYRLQNPPRDAECSIYLLKNPALHGVLATLAAVAAGEWEILVSGRFDGFLWSGADTSSPSALPSSRGQSDSARRGVRRVGRMAVEGGGRGRRGCLDGRASMRARMMGLRMDGVSWRPMIVRVMFLLIAGGRRGLRGGHRRLLRRRMRGRLVVGWRGRGRGGRGRGDVMEFENVGGVIGWDDWTFCFAIEVFDPCSHVVEACFSDHHPPFCSLLSPSSCSSLQDMGYAMAWDHGIDHQELGICKRRFA